MSSLSHSSAPFLRYPIREIAEVANQVLTLDPSRPIAWENIGDPIAKGWPVPPFLKTILHQTIDASDAVFGYAHSRGEKSTREFIANLANEINPAAPISAEDVLCTNGLGAAIPLIYQMLPPSARILQPAPGYPTHASCESFFAGAPPIYYHLDARNNWQINLSEIENLLNTNSNIAGILIINPNNPTGAVCDSSVLEKIVALAKQKNLFIIADEIYQALAYDQTEFRALSQLCANQVPLIVMRGMSKDVPWPGGRGGWLEFHNQNLHPEFANLVKNIKQRALLEVGAAHLPQTVLPLVYGHAEYKSWVNNLRTELQEISADIVARLQKIPQLSVVAPRGAFYVLPLFSSGVLTLNQTLPIANAAVREYIEKLVARPGILPDERLALYLLGAERICVVPASGFGGGYCGFRVTTLERDPSCRAEVYGRLERAIAAYLES